MTTRLALCPDGVKRAYTPNGDIAIVEVRGSSIRGKITEVGGVTKFRVLAQHHGAHLMWYPAPADLALGDSDRLT